VRRGARDVGLLSTPDAATIIIFILRSKKTRTKTNAETLRTLRYAEVKKI
jgi:hypothetical protein